MVGLASCPMACVNCSRVGPPNAELHDADGVFLCVGVFSLCPFRGWTLAVCCLIPNAFIEYQPIYCTHFGSQCWLMLVDSFLITWVLMILWMATTMTSRFQGSTRSLRLVALPKSLGYLTQLRQKLGQAALGISPGTPFPSLESCVESLGRHLSF